MFLDTTYPIFQPEIFSSAFAGGKLSHADIQHLPGRLDQGILVLALPLDLSTHLAIRHAIYGFSILNGVIMLQNCLLYTSDAADE